MSDYEKVWYMCGQGNIFIYSLFLPMQFPVYQKRHENSETMLSLDNVRQDPMLLFRIRLNVSSFIC